MRTYEEIVQNEIQNHTRDTQARPQNLSLQIREEVWGVVVVWVGGYCPSIELIGESVSLVTGLLLVRALWSPADFARLKTILDPKCQIIRDLGTKRAAFNITC